MAERIQISKIDAFALATMIVAGIVIWSRGQYQGWSFLIVAIYFVLFELFCLRLDYSFFKGVAISALIATGILVLIALAFSMRAPPLMAGADYEWPPFNNFRERLGNAILLSFWQIAMAPIGVVSAFIYAVATREWLMRKKDPEQAFRNDDL